MNSTHPELRSPKSEAMPKPEAQSQPPPFFGFRNSGFLRTSDFGFRIFSYASVDVNRLGVHVSRAVAGKEGNQFADFFRSARPAQCAMIDVILPLLVRHVLAHSA